MLVGVIHICICICVFNLFVSAARTGEHPAPGHTYTHARFTIVGAVRMQVCAYAYVTFVFCSPAFISNVHTKNVRTRPYLQVGWAETKVDGLPPAFRFLIESSSGTMVGPMAVDDAEL